MHPAMRVSVGLDISVWSIKSLRPIYKSFYFTYLKQFEVLSADDVVQLGEEEDEDRPAEEGEHAADHLDPGLEAQRAAPVPGLSAGLAELDELRSEGVIIILILFSFQLFATWQLSSNKEGKVLQELEQVQTIWKQTD